MALEDGNIVWSDDSETVRNVVYSSYLPVIVRVAEGYYGGNEAESFSIGDLLKLDYVKSVQKIYATVISSWSDAILEDKTGYMQPDHEIIIPLLYKGKVTIARPPSEFKVYCTVSELLRDFPKFLRVESEFFAQSSQDKTVRVEVGKRLELDRYLPNQGLVAKYEGNNVILKQDMRGRFIPLPDDKEYTLKEVVDTLPLPQYVKFVEDEFEKVLTTDLQSAIDNVQTFTGCVKLTRVFREEVVVGHHKPQLENVSQSLRLENEKFVQRSIVLLPLGREAVNEIEVNTPIYSEPDEYELLAIRNFSQKSPNMDLVEGSLYLEFSKNPRSFYVFDEKEENDDNVNDVMDSGEPPPPVPPRPPREMKQDILANVPTNKPLYGTGVSREKKVSSKEDEKPPERPKRPHRPVVTISEADEDYEPVDEPKPMEPKKHVKNRKKHYQNAAVKPHPVTPAQKQMKETKTSDAKETFDGPLLIYEVPDNIHDDYIALPQKAQKIVVPVPFYKKLKRVHSELVSKFKSKTPTNKTEPQMPLAVSQPLPVSPVSKSPVDQLAPPSIPTRFNPPLSPSTSEPKEKFKPPPSPTARLPPDRTAYDSPIGNPYCDTKNKTVNHPPRPKQKPKANAKAMPSAPKIVVKTNPIISEEGEDDMEDYDYPDVSKMLPQIPEGKQDRPVGKVQPSTRPIPSTQESRLSQMSVKELVSCLQQCALSKLAVLCNEHKMDGQFIADLDEGDLNKEPFNLNLIEIAKLKKMKTGWRPRIE